MKNRIAVLLIAVTLFGGGFVTAKTGVPALAQEGAFPLSKMREFAEVFQIVKESYVEDISDEKLMENAIRGMIDGLDPHSQYLAATSLQDFEKGIHASQYGGVGIYVGERDGWVEVVTPIDGTPAARANLKPGDIIVKINGVTTHRMGLDEAVSQMRGKVGTFIRLEVLTAGTEPRIVELRREKIVVSSAVSALAEPDYGYLRISRFQHETVSDAIRNLNKLYADNGRPLQGIILDLRNNPGGLWDSSVGIASIFLPDSVTVVSGRGRTSEDNIFLSAAKHYHGLGNEDNIKSVPMVALVNNGSASASEIVAGALQDNQRALIIGEQTYGKASVQSLVRLESTSYKTGIKLTTARYFTPANRSIQSVGITPDIVIAEAEAPAEDSGSSQAQEEGAGGNLNNDDPAATAEESAVVNENPFLPRDDNQYEQALTVLKGLVAGG